MKKTFLTFIVIFFIFVSPVLAEDVEYLQVGATYGLTLRDGPGTDKAKIVTMPFKGKVELISRGHNGPGCEKDWYKIKYLKISSVGYACSTYLEKYVEPEPIVTPPVVIVAPQYKTDEEFFAYLKSEGFPESYYDKLNELRKLHPNWIFKASMTKYAWTRALDTQDINGRSLYCVNQTGINNGLEGFLSTAVGNYDWEKDIFKSYDGYCWKQANRETIAYYLDPRNYLSENRIFAFEHLYYQKELHVQSVVEDILAPVNMIQYAPIFMKAAEKTGVSPVHLASLSRQEVGNASTNIVVNGKAGVLSDGVNYTGYYNFFNWGASSSSNPKLKSLQQAKAFKWNNPEIAIIEGSELISNTYVKAGQDTSYYRKYNTSKKATKGEWHQYSTNISDPLGTALTTFNSYKKRGIIDVVMSFYIPVYDGMPDKTSLPPLGNPNNFLKELKVNGVSISNFSGYESNYEVQVLSNKVMIEGSTVNSRAMISGLGSFDLNEESKSFDVTVTAANNTTKKYTIKVTKAKPPVEPENPTPGPNPPVVEEPVVNLDNVQKESGYIFKNYIISNIGLGTNVRILTNNILKNNVGVSVNVKEFNNQPKTEGTISTGDKVIISNKNETRTYEVLIYGDVKGNGNIGIVDLGMIQKHILNMEKLKGINFKAADLNKDGAINVVDLGILQKHILRISYIGQS